MGGSTLPAPALGVIALGGRVVALALTAREHVEEAARGNARGVIAARALQRRPGAPAPPLGVVDLHGSRVGGGVNPTGCVQTPLQRGEGVGRARPAGVGQPPPAIAAGVVDVQPPRRLGEGPRVSAVHVQLPAQRRSCRMVHPGRERPEPAPAVAADVVTLEDIGAVRAEPLLEPADHVDVPPDPSSRDLAARHGCRSQCPPSTRRRATRRRGTSALVLAGADGQRHARHGQQRHRRGRDPPAGHPHCAAARSRVCSAW